MPGGWERLLDRDVLSQREHGCPVATARENREVLTKSAAEMGRQLSVVKERAGEGLSKRTEEAKVAPRRPIEETKTRYTQGVRSTVRVREREWVGPGAGRQRRTNNARRGHSGQLAGNYS